MLSRGLMFAVLAFSLQAQTPNHRYDALKDALGLSDSQLAQLRQEDPPPEVIRQPAGVFQVNPFSAARVGNFHPPMSPSTDPEKYGLLDDSQRAKLESIVEKVWMHPPTPELAVVMELTSAYQWPRDQCRRDTRVGASNLDLTSSQLAQLIEQRQSAGPSLVPEIGWREWRRNMTLNYGWPDPPAVAKAVAELPALREQAAKRREQALAVLDDGQKARLAEFEAALQLVSEAGSLHLISNLGGGEVLCQ